MGTDDRDGALEGLSPSSSLSLQYDGGTGAVYPKVSYEFD